MVKINYCPSCGCRLSQGSFVCPSCNLDIEELFGRGYLLISNDGDNSIELFGGDIDDLAVDDLSNSVIYDLSGRRISSGRANASVSLKKGLYLYNGKKFIVK